MMHVGYDVRCGKISDLQIDDVLLFNKGSPLSSLHLMSEMATVIVTGIFLFRCWVRDSTSKSICEEAEIY